MKTIGVLALQGAFIEHCSHIERLGHCPRQVRVPSELEGLDGLILPGGESTAIGKLLQESGLGTAIIGAYESGLPIWGTCAGMILLAKEIEGQTETHMPLMSIQVQRNAYGRQLGSFVAQTFVPFLNLVATLPFIRAPYISNFSEDVEPLLALEGRLVAARTQRLLVTAFHPELTAENHWHRYFIDTFCN